MRTSRLKALLTSWPLSVELRAPYGASAHCLMPVAPGPENLPTFHMTLKNAAFLAFVGMALATALLAFDLIENLLNVVRGLIPAVKVFSALVFTFAAFCVAVFFFVFQRAQR